MEMSSNYDEPDLYNMTKNELISEISTLCELDSQEILKKLKTKTKDFLINIIEDMNCPTENTDEYDDELVLDEYNPLKSIGPALGMLLLMKLNKPIPSSQNISS